MGIENLRIDTADSPSDFPSFPFPKILRVYLKKILATLPITCKQTTLKTKETARTKTMTGSLHAYKRAAKVSHP